MPSVDYDPTEQETLLRAFSGLLSQVTKDGGTKRQAGLKPPWYEDSSHEAAIFSHLNKWKHGELVDPDSGAHPLVHLAWRALAIAWQETHGKVSPPLSIEWAENLTVGKDGYLSFVYEQEVDDQPDEEPEGEEPEGASPVTDKLPDEIRKWLMRVSVVR